MNENAEQEALVPIALVALESGEPVEWVVDHFGELLQLDHAGMRAIPVEAARRFFAETAEQKSRMEEQSRRLQEELESQRPPAGIPRPANADPTMSAYEVMRAADEERERSDPSRRPTPFEEFLQQRVGNPRKVVVEDEQR